MTSNDYPTAICPKCKVEQDDMDGFGILYCELCGYCTHPGSVMDEKDGHWYCDLCGEKLHDADDPTTKDH